MTGTTKPRKYMFICAYGRARSPTAARVANVMAEKAGVNIYSEHLAGGIEDEALDDLGRRGRKAFGAMLRSYNRLFVMEDDMAGMVQKYRVSSKKIVCLDIQDEYWPDSPELVGILEKKLKKWIR